MAFAGVGEATPTTRRRTCWDEIHTAATEPGSDEYHCRLNKQFAAVNSKGYRKCGKFKLEIKSQCKVRKGADHRHTQSEEERASSTQLENADYIRTHTERKSKNNYREQPGE